MKALEDSVRSVQMEGLVWGASKLVPIGYGIRKLQITLVVGMYFARVWSTDNGAHTRQQRMNLYRSMSSRRSLLSLRIMSRVLTLPRCRVSVQVFFGAERGSDSFHRAVSCVARVGVALWDMWLTAVLE